MSLCMRPALPPRRRSPRTARLRTQGGGTLVEVLSAIAILSILMIGVMAGMTTSAKVSGATGQVGATRSALETATDRAATMAYPGCVSDLGQLSTLVRAAGAASPGFTVEVTAVKYLVPLGVPTCSTATTAQMLSIRVVQTSSGLRARGDVVLRNSDPAARPGP